MLFPVADLWGLSLWPVWGGPCGMLARFVQPSETKRMAVLGQRAASGAASRGPYTSR